VWDTILKVDRIPAHQGKILPTMAMQGAGGMATVAAVTIARLGYPVALWTRIGDDAIGRLIVEDLAKECIDNSGVRQIIGGTTPFSTILVDSKGERLVLPYFDSSLPTDPSYLNLGDIGAAAAVLSDMRWIEGASVAFKEARRLGVPTILDADVASTEDLLNLIPLADHVLFSEPALRSLIDAEPATALLEISRNLNAKVVGVTVGARGALILSREMGADVITHFPTIAINPQDTLNAGDVWHGTYAYGTVSGWSLTRTVQAANISAAMKCEHFGGRRGAPRLPELSVRISEHKQEISSSTQILLGTGTILKNQN
jgi:sulfofructose kinase